MGVQIPPQYRGKLEPIEVSDTRTDDEILRFLSNYQPVVSEKNVWTFWDSGLDGMPAWCRRNVVSWVRICGPQWTVRVLDSNPDSPNYAAKYVPKGLPDSFYNNTMDGTHSGPHSADFLRGACLYEYGGAWVDSSTFLMRTMDDICWKQLEESTSPWRVAVPVMSEDLLNCFLAARKHDPFIKRWHEIFMHVWKDRTNADGLAQHPLLSPVVPFFMQSLAKQMTEGLGLNVPMDKLVEYGAQIACWRRLCMLEDAGDGFSGVDYWLKNILWIDLPRELVRPFYDEESNIFLLNAGPKLFDLFSMKRDDHSDLARYTEAEKAVWTQLTESSMLKIGTIKGMVDWVSLGTLWNMQDNLGKDSEPGTFAELLRYVPLHFRQTREGILTLKAIRPPTTFKKGVLEP
ncbi:capsular polysaccharide synthesis protein-domain-containing protein [Nemania abortiva]|nr:capsular polysaccharide synthesis protein-domain-containing protein [Nemania abortiva]